MNKLSYSLIALAFTATAAQAQDTAQDTGALPADQDAAPQEAVPPAPDAETPPPSAAEAAPPPAAAAPQAGAVTSASVTDAEVQNYAEATVKVQAIAKDTSIEQQAKQAKLIAAVTEAGLAPERFNAISKAAGSDTELRTRIQTALSAHAAAHQG